MPSESYSSPGGDTFIVPADVTMLAIECWGAGGGDAAASGASGGYARGILPVTPGEVLDVHVGGQGGQPAGGINGGGQGGDNSYATAGGGGGASDVRQGGDALSDRVIAAGGGGGSSGSTGSTAADGGRGGTNSGEDGLVPTGLEDWLDPIASESLVDAQPVKSLVRRGEVRK